ncbi:MAG: hypothetical protein H6828_13125 [Planctomycetes bacterium]|nr:hypothetical protein [Planctomycetota bacterium]
MDTRQIRTLEDPSTATAAELEEALAHWDELDARSLARLDAHPEHGLRLRLLRASEGWLSRGAALDTAPAGPCPPAEVLYEHGRGPGAHGAPRDPEVTAHLERCVVCAGLVASLESAPPLPLEWTSLRPDELEPDEDESGRHDGRVLGPSPTSSTAPEVISPWFARWFPLAAAAALLVGVFVAPRMWSDSSLSGLPRPELLRGAESAALLFPRGPVLAAANGSAAPLFELAEVPGASQYRVELYLQGADAFAPGQLVATLLGATPTLASEPLAAGRYTWRAWATVDGLERELGALDFEVRADAAFGAADAPAGTRALVARIAALHEAGYRTDARALAQRLPDGPEKEAYLRPPGR